MPTDEGFVALVSLHAFETEGNLEHDLARAATVYGNHIAELRAIIASIGCYRESRTPIPARLVWDVGDRVFDLVDTLRDLSFEIEGLYQHLERDLQVKRKWLEKAIILRRYVPDRELLPEDLNWGRCEKGTRRFALKLVGGDRLE